LREEESEYLGLSPGRNIRQEQMGRKVYKD